MCFPAFFKDFFEMSEPCNISPRFSMNFLTAVTFRGHLGFTIPLSTKVGRQRNGTAPDLDFESDAADRLTRCPCAGIPAIDGPAHPLDGCLDCSL